MSMNGGISPPPPLSQKFGTNTGGNQSCPPPPPPMPLNTAPPPPPMKSAPPPPPPPMSAAPPPLPPGAKTQPPPAPTNTPAPPLPPPMSSAVSNPTPVPELKKVIPKPRPAIDAKKNSSTALEKKDEVEKKAMTEEELMQMHEKLKSNTRTAKRRIARNKNVIHDLLDNIKRSPRFTSMLIYNINIFPSLAVDETSVEELIEEGVLEALLHVQQLNPMNESINKVINDCIASFCINDYCTNLVYQRIGLGPIPYSLKMHKEPETLLGACTAAQKLMRIKASVVSFADAGIVGLLGVISQDQSADPAIIAKVASCLATVCETLPVQIPAVIDCENLVTNVLGCVEKNPKHKELAEHALRFLSVLSMDPALIEYLRSLGSIDLVAAVLEGDDSALLLRLGAKVIKSISGDQDVIGLLHYRGVSAEMTGVLGKLAALVLVDKNALAFIENGGVLWLLEVMTEAAAQGLNEVTTPILITGNKILERVCNSYANTYNVIENGGLTVVQDILLKFAAQSAEISNAAVLVLDAMVHHESCDYLLDCGLLVELDKVTTAHKDVSSCVMNVCKIWEKLTAQPVIHAKLVYQGIVDRLLFTLTTHKDDAQVIASALKCVANLAKTREGADALMQARIQDYLPAIVAAHPGNEVVVNGILQLLLKLLENVDGDALLELAALKNDVLKAMQSCKDSDSINLLGTEVLELLTKKGTSTCNYYVRKVYDTACKVHNAPSDAEMVQQLAVNLAMLKNLCADSSKKEELLTANAQTSLVKSISAALLLPTGDIPNMLLKDAIFALQAILHSNVLEAQFEGSAFTDLFRSLQQQGEGASEEDAQAAVEFAAKVVKLASKKGQLEHLTQSDLLDNVMQIAATFSFNDQIQNAAATVLAAFTSVNKDKVVELVVSGAGSAVLVAGVTNQSKKDSKDLPFTLNNIIGLCEAEAANKTLLGIQFPSTLVGVLSKHITSDVIVDNTLANVIAMFHAVNDEDYPDVLAAFQEAKIIPLLLKILNTHYEDADIISAAISALSCLSGSTSAIDEMLELYPNQEELISWLQEQHNDTEFVDAAILLHAVDKHRMFLNSDEEQLHRKEEIADKSQKKLKSIETSKNESEIDIILQTIEDACKDPVVCRMIALNGGLDSLSNIIGNNVYNEKAFKRASNLYNLMSDNNDEEILTILESDNHLDSQVNILKPKVHFKTPLDDQIRHDVIVTMGKFQMSDGTSSRLLKNGGLGLLSQVIVKVEERRVLEAGSKILGAATFNDNVNDKMIDNILSGSDGFSTIRELIDAMRRHIDNQEFLRYGIFLLSSLAVSNDIKNEIGIQSGVHLIMTIIQKYINENYNLTKNCFVALAQLSYNCPINCAFITACNVLPLILKGMELYTTHLELLDASASIIINLCYDNDTNKTAITKLNAPQIMVQRVLDNFKEQDVVINLMNAIANLVHNPVTAGSILSVGAVQACVAVWTTFTTDLTVVKTTLTLLERLAVNISVDQMQTMSQEGGVQAVLEVLSMYNNNVDIALPAATALCSLSTDMTMSDFIIKRNGCEIIIVAIQKIGYITEFLDMALRVLYNLTFSVNNFNRVLNSGVPDIIRKSLQSQVSSYKIITIGLSAIRNLCYSDDVAIRLDNDGMSLFALSLWQRFLTGSKVGYDNVIIEVASTLSVLGRPEQNALGILDTALQVATSTLRLITNNTPVNKEVCAFLANIFVHANVSLAAMNSTIIDDITYIIGIQKDNVELLLIACKALENMAYGGQPVRDIMLDKNVIDLMQKVIDKNADRQDMVVAATNVINAINKKDFVPTSYEFLDLSRMQKQVKDVYETLGETRNDPNAIVTELPPHIKNFLTAGALLIKHSKTAVPRPRHVYVTDDLKWLVWKDPKTKVVDEEQRMKIFKIRSIELGRCTPQLQRKKQFGGYYANEDCAFSIQGRERTVDLEVSNPSDRRKWVEAIEHLIAYRKSIQSQQQNAAQF